MTEHSEHPEGVQVAIEILQNVPDGLLEDFAYNTELEPDYGLKDAWEDLVNKWYGKDLDNRK